MRYWLLLMLAVSSFEIFAAEKKVGFRDLPPAVQAAVTGQSVGATVKGYSKEVEKGTTTFEAEMTVNGHSKDVSFDPTGKVVSIEEEVTLDSIPTGAREAIQRAVGKGQLRKVELVTEGGKSFYEAALKKNGKSSEIHVDATGAPVK